MSVIGNIQTLSLCFDVYSVKRLVDIFIIANITIHAREFSPLDKICNTKYS